ncbi:hypothetical protein, partial [Pseudomonas savastanoi]|uniref:hypothetical protein n=2 Tax=Pseudomonas savastanoi TaxID=29438 RepID=UPI001B80B8EC
LSAGASGVLMETSSICTGPGWPPGDGFVDNKIEQTKEKVNEKPSIRWFVFFSVSQPHETMRFYG